MPICVFYLTLRALDTVEDDMQNFKTVEEKTHHLHNFYTYLDTEGWNMDGVGEGSFRVCWLDELISLSGSLSLRRSPLFVSFSRRSPSLSPLSSCTLSSLRTLSFYSSLFSLLLPPISYASSPRVPASL